MIVHHTLQNIIKIVAERAVTHEIPLTRPHGEADVNMKADVVQQLDVETWGKTKDGQGDTTMASCLFFRPGEILTALVPVNCSMPAKVSLKGKNVHYCLFTIVSCSMRSLSLASVVQT